MVCGLHLRTFFLLAALTVHSNADGQGELEQLDDDREIIHKFLDDLLFEVTTNFKEHKLDPVKLPDNESTRKVGILNINSGFSTTKGELRGLSTLYRSGEVLVSWERGSTVQVEADLSANDLNVSTDARAWLGELKVNFFMSARVKHLRAKVGVELPLQSGGQPRVTSFVIRDVGTIKLDFRRLGPLNVVLEGLGYLFLNALRNVIKNRVASLVLVEMNKEIGKMRLPSLSDISL